jgi:hypothetical protein
VIDRNVAPAPPPPVGRVVATELKPSTPHQFHFWTGLETAIGIGAIVRVEGTGQGEVGKVVFGVVTDGFAYSDLVSPLHDVAGADGDPVRATEVPTVRRDPAVDRRRAAPEPEEPLQPVPWAGVSPAIDVARALRMDAYLHGAAPTAVPVGLYSAGGLEAPVYLDADFLLGPEAAHLNISGVSGLATKTSAVEFLLASIFRHFPAHKGRVAAVCFNVKGSDLCFLDQPGALDEEDRRRYARLDVPPEPFGNVRYFAPFKADGVNLNTLRTHPDLAGDVESLVWGLPEVLDFAEVLLNRDDIDAKADAFIDFLSDRVLGREFEDGFGRTHRVQSFADLDALFRSIMDGVEMTGRGDMWRTHHIATIRKVRNRLSNVSTRCKGLVADDGPSSDLPWGHFEDRAVYVIDIANVDPLGQDLVFARVVSKLREHLERRDLGVDTVVVFVDELNKYAPGEGPETYVKKMLLDIRNGRYLGSCSSAPSSSAAAPPRRDAGHGFGRMDADELATPGYQVLSPATKVKLATLRRAADGTTSISRSRSSCGSATRRAGRDGVSGSARRRPAVRGRRVRLMLRIDRGIAPTGQGSDRGAAARGRPRRGRGRAPHPADRRARLLPPRAGRPRRRGGAARARAGPAALPHRGRSLLMRLRAGGGLAAVLIAGCAAGASNAAPVTLRFRPAAGTLNRYVYEQRVTIQADSGTPLPPQDVTLRIYLTQAVGAGEADGIPVTSTIDSVSLDNGALPASFLEAVEGRARGLQTVTVLDQRMRTVRHEVVNRSGLDAGRLDAFEQGTSGLAFPLPEGPVRVGDSWTVTTRLPTGQMLPGTAGPLEAATTLTVRQVRIAGSDTAVLLDVESRLPEAPISVDMGIGRSALRLSGTLAGEQEFSVSRGTVLRASMAGEIRVEMSGGIAGDRTMGMTLDQRLTIRMLEGP